MFIITPCWSLLAAAGEAGGTPDALYEACIGRIAGGDKDALGTLYENTKDAVYGFALSIVRNAQEAEDVLQDTFVSVFTSAPNYRKMGKPMAWVFTIARNLSLMKVRDRRRTADVSDAEWDMFPADARDTPGEDRLALAAALRELAPVESQIVILHAVAGFKHREIAGLLELPLSTVLSKYNRALRKLKSVLEGA